MNSNRTWWIAILVIIVGFALWRIGARPERAASTPPTAISARAAPPREAPAAEAQTTADRATAAGPDTPAPRPVAAPSAANPGDDEAAAMAKIREAVRSDPKAALALLDAADKEHLDGSFAEERAALRVDALVGTGAIGAARDAAEAFLRRYPSSAHAAHVAALTGVHPPPAGPNQR